MATSASQLQARAWRWRRTSTDIVAVIDTVSGLAFIAILILAAARGFVIGRALSSRIFRNRAYWTGLLCVMLALQAQVPNDWMVGGLPIFELTFFVMFCVFFVFIDSTNLVALEMDFFHRNTLRWRQGRLVAYPVFFGFVVLNLVTLYLSGLPNPPAWVSSLENGPEFVLFFVMFVYSIVTLTIGAKRSPNRNLRQHVLLLTFFFVLFLANTFIFNYTSVVAVDLLADVLTVFGAFVLYRAVMTLSPLGRVEKGTRIETGEDLTRRTGVSPV